MSSGEIMRIDEKLNAFLVALGRESTPDLRKALFVKLDMNDYAGFYSIVPVGKDSFKTLRQACGFGIEQTVMTLKAPKPFHLNFVIKEYIGPEVYLKDENGLHVALALEDLKEGTEIFVPALFGGYYRMTVKDVRDKTAGACSGPNETGTGAFLEYDKDDRHCWVASGVFNLDAMKKLDFS